MSLITLNLEMIHSLKGPTFQGISSLILWFCNLTCLFMQSQGHGPVLGPINVIDPVHSGMFVFEEITCPDQFLLVFS